MYGSYRDLSGFEGFETVDLNFVLFYLDVIMLAVRLGVLNEKILDKHWSSVFLQYYISSIFNHMYPSFWHRSQRYLLDPVVISKLHPLLKPSRDITNCSNNVSCLLGSWN